MCLMSEAEGSLDGDPMSDTDPPQAASGGRGSEGGEQAARPTTAEFVETKAVVR